jgi:AGZA family xanthine/uracil permease-like MFS transporter
VLSFFGFMHGEAIGVMQAPLVALSYAAVSLILFACAKASLRATPMARPTAGPETVSMAGTAD